MEPAAPPPPPIPRSTPPLPQRGWWARNWKWFVPTGCLGLLLFAFGFASLIMFTVFGMIKSSDAYKGALDRAKKDPQVIAAIGTPIKEAWYVGGTTEVSGSSGKSDLTIPIRGPKGEATIYAIATKFAGEWRYTQLLVKIKNTGQAIDLAGTNTDRSQ